MRIFALELDNEIKGIDKRKEYIERLIGKLEKPELIVLPELALCSYMASQEIWKYADHQGADTAEWAMKMAQKYDTYIGVGYLDQDEGDYYNRYLIAGKEGVCGVVSKSEGESAVFKRGDFGSTISTPFGTVGVGICFDSRRKHFYENVKDETLSLILFPHGCPAVPKKPEKEHRENDQRCMMYVHAFGVPVVYVNSVGKLEYMPGMMGRMMERAGFRMNGMSKIYGLELNEIQSTIPEAVAADVGIHPGQRVKDIRFHGEDILPGNWLFKQFILKPDTEAGVKLYNAGVAQKRSDGLNLRNQEGF